MKLIKMLVLGLALAGPSIADAAVRAGIMRNDHDFSTNSTWNTKHGVCSPCHQAHHTDPAQTAPLWNHALSTTAFTPYSSSTMQATPGSPNGTSLACLSCHDGTVGINTLLPSLGGAGTNAEQKFADFPGIAMIKQIGGNNPTYGETLGDLHASHPISFVYDSALAAADGALEDPNTYHIGDPKVRLGITTAPVPAAWPVPAQAVSIVGKTISQSMLDTQGRLQCAGCHDLHRIKGASPGNSDSLLVEGLDVEGRGSLLCRTCHVK